MNENKLNNMNDKTNELNSQNNATEILDITADVNNETSKNNSDTSNLPKQENVNNSQNEVNTSNQTNNPNISKLRIGGKKVSYQLDANGNVINSQMENKNESKNMALFVLGFFGLLLLVVFVIPTIYQNLNNTDYQTKHYEEKEDTSNLIDDKYIELGTKAHITDKETEIKFNNFKKETQRAGIQFDVKANSSVSDVNQYNIAIKVYDKDKNLIHISKFTSSNKIETTIKRYYIHLSEAAYNSAYYVEVTNYTEDKKDTLTCTNNRTASGVTVNETNQYSFVGEMLTSYTVTKEAKASDSDSSVETYKNKYKSEYDNLLLTNIDSTKITLDDAKITYTIDLATFKEQTSSYTRNYEYGDTLDFIKKTETANGWTCK